MEASRAEGFPEEAAAAVFRVAEDRLAAAVRQEASERKNKPLNYYLIILK